jgi:uncharacterized protein
MNEEITINLYKAIENNDLESVRLLLEKGANSNITYKGKTPIFAAVDNNNLKIVSLLISFGADTNIPYKGKTPIFAAVDNNNLEIVSLLIAFGANPNIPYKGETPIFAAVDKDNIIMISALLELGADPFFVSEHEENEGDDVISIAISSNLDEILKIILQKIDLMPELATKYFMISTSCENFEAMRIFFEKKPNVNHIDEFGNNPLLYCAIQSLEVLSEIMKCAPEINIQNKLGFTPLMLASYHGKLENVKLLVSKGANLYLRDSDGKSALHTAIIRGHENIAIFLSENQTEIEEDTIILAVENEMPDLCKSLVSKGVNIDILDKERTPVLIKLIEKGYIDTAISAIKKGANPNVFDSEGATALMCAAADGFSSLAYEIIKRIDNNINKQMSDYSTAAHIAAKMGHAEQGEYFTVLKLLENNYADFSIKDSSGKTPMDYLDDEEKKLYLSHDEIFRPEKRRPDEESNSYSANPESTPKKVDYHDDEDLGVIGSSSSSGYDA